MKTKMKTKTTSRRTKTLATKATKRKTKTTSKPVVAVIGCGFVGDAVAYGFRRVAKVLEHDVDPDRSKHTLEQCVEQAEFLFICVPTPTSKATGRIDLMILAKVIGDIAALKPDVGQIVIVKSTVVPGTMEGYAKHCGTMRFAYNPEFLTERTARKDFAKPTRIVIGADEARTRKRVAALYRKRFAETPMIECTLAEAQMIKYACNCFFATKITFLNELYQICRAGHARFDVVRKGLLSSGWVNPMHTLVPGPDRRFGFGGKCFPKDTMAFRSYAESIGIMPKVLNAVIEKNGEIRGKDWEGISGAIS